MTTSIVTALDRTDGALTRAVLVDDHQLLAQTLALALGFEGIECTVADLSDRQSLVQGVVEGPPALVLLDLDLGGVIGDGGDLVGALRRCRLPGPRGVRLDRRRAGVPGARGRRRRRHRQGRALRSPARSGPRGRAGRAGPVVRRAKGDARRGTPAAQPSATGPALPSSGSPPARPRCSAPLRPVSRSARSPRPGSSPRPPCAARCARSSPSSGSPHSSRPSPPPTVVSGWPALPSIPDQPGDQGPVVRDGLSPCAC